MAQFDYMLPLRRLDVLVREAEDGVLVLDRARGVIHQLNATAGFIWAKCDGSVGVGEIASALAAEYGQPEEVVRRDVEKVIAQLAALELLQDSDRR